MPWYRYGGEGSSDEAGQDEEAGSEAESRTRRRKRARRGTRGKDSADVSEEDTTEPKRKRQRKRAASRGDTTAASDDGLTEGGDDDGIEGEANPLLLLQAPERTDGEKLESSSAKYRGMYHCEEAAVPHFVLVVPRRYNQPIKQRHPKG